MSAFNTMSSSRRRPLVVLLTGAFVVFPILIGCGTLSGCGPGSKELAAVEYAPLQWGDWKISTPSEEGLDPMLVARLYNDASKLSTLYGLLVIKDGKLIAEKYFKQGSVEQLSGRQSVTKSFTSALAGIALEQGRLKSLDQKMMDFFPEYKDRIGDPRKNGVTIRQMLQMRAGYPWEGHYPKIFDIMFMHNNWRWLPHLVDIPLVMDPGTGFGYSNLTSHLLGVVVARACETDLETYARKYLFDPIGAKVGKWNRDEDGYNWGHFEIYVTARDMARFGLLYLNGGEFEGKRVLPASWVRDSLQMYSKGINFTGWLTSRLGGYFRDLGYGYQWWSAGAGSHRFDFAWGHGGQLIVLLHDLDMVVVTTADPIYNLPEEKGWEYEGAIIDVVGKFIKSLPKAVRGT